jgi:hypothetical protein
MGRHEFKETLSGLTPLGVEWRVANLIMDRSGDRWVLVSTGADIRGEQYNMLDISGRPCWVPNSLTSLEIHYGPLVRFRIIHGDDLIPSRPMSRCDACSQPHGNTPDCLHCQAIWTAHRLTPCIDCYSGARPYAHAGNL